MKMKTSLNQEKLFLAYEECRADNTAHMRKIIELQKRVEELVTESKKMRDYANDMETNALVISNKNFDNWMFYMHRANKEAAKVRKLKALLLLTDEVVENVTMGELQIKQWDEYIKCFPEDE